MKLDRDHLNQYNKASDPAISCFENGKIDFITEPDGDKIGLSKHGMKFVIREWVKTANLTKSDKEELKKLFD